MKEKEPKNRFFIFLVSVSNEKPPVARASKSCREDFSEELYRKIFNSRLIQKYGVDRAVDELKKLFPKD